MVKTANLFFQWFTSRKLVVIPPRSMQSYFPSGKIVMNYALVLYSKIFYLTTKCNCHHCSVLPSIQLSYKWSCPAFLTMCKESRNEAGLQKAVCFWFSSLRWACDSQQINVRVLSCFQPLLISNVWRLLTPPYMQWVSSLSANDSQSLYHIVLDILVILTNAGWLSTGWNAYDWISDTRAILHFLLNQNQTRLEASN